MVASVIALLPAEKRKRVLSGMPTEEGILVWDIKYALVAHGFLLEPANQQYNSEGDTSFNLLQKQACKLVVNFELTYPKGKTTSHFVAWNGEHIIDTTHKIKVNSTTDRKNPENSRLAFSNSFLEP